jgi:Polyketide cyclase / dehydrase and lipid transport
LNEVLKDPGLRHKESIVPLLQKDETLAASIEVRASADQVYAVISDVTRIPEWSPETRRAEWLAPDRFRAWNRRRLGRWRTVANVVEAWPGHKFSFVVQALGGDWTQWTYLIEPGSTVGTTRLTETIRMCVPLPFSAVVFERLFLFVRDRRSDLQANLDLSVNRIRNIVEAGVGA